MDPVFRRRIYHHLQDRLSKDGMMLRHEANDVCSDREFVMMAVQQNGLALMFALGEARRDPEIIWTAIENDPRAAIMVENPTDEMLFRAIKNYPVLIRRFADSNKYAMDCVRENGLVLEFVVPSTPHYRAISLAAVKQNGSAVLYTVLKYDLEINLQAVKQDERALFYSVLDIEKFLKISQFILKSKKFAILPVEIKRLILKTLAIEEK